MSDLTPEERELFKSLSSGKNGDIFRGFVKKRLEKIYANWVSKIDEPLGAHLRGKASEWHDVVKLLDSLK